MAEALAEKIAGVPGTQVRLRHREVGDVRR
jgi:hypothetical protein